MLNLDCRSEETEEFDDLAELDAKFEQTSDSLDNISSQISAIKSSVESLDARLLSLETLKQKVAGDPY